MNSMWRTTLASLFTFAPILFDGISFAMRFSRAIVPDIDFGANIAGAMLGGFAEYTSMLVGFRYLVVVAVAFYSLSAISRKRRATTANDDISSQVAVALSSPR